VLSYLAATPPTAPYDNTLEDIVQRAIVGITGIEPALVRPRIQPEPPNIPDKEAAWVAFSVTVEKWDQFAYTGRVAQRASTDATPVERDEWLELFMSFYGPTADALVSRWVQGLSVDRNREELRLNGISLSAVQAPVHVPALFKQTWVRRVDIKVTLTRRIRSMYNLPTVVGVVWSLDNERWVENIEVKGP
jgi:hypothetical protein